MKLCRFLDRSERVRIGLSEDGATILDLTDSIGGSLEGLLEQDPAGRLAALEALARQPSARIGVADVRLLPPVELQEVWAVGVTYLRSKKARMEESDFSATAYDRVYDAERPELFFKAMPAKVVGPGGAVGIRADARWSVPEPELAFIINSRGQLVGFTIGNDMSSRDIEGENLLYLPQAKIYDRACALGPWIQLGESEAEARTWQIHLEISRAGAVVFRGETSVQQIKRSFAELIGYLMRSQTFPHGVILLTGTGIVPPDTFTLLAGDTVRIRISGIGALENTVVSV